MRANAPCIFFASINQDFYKNPFSGDSNLLRRSESQRYPFSREEMPTHIHRPRGGKAAYVTSATKSPGVYASASSLDTILKKHRII